MIVTLDSNGLYYGVTKEHIFVGRTLLDVITGAFKCLK